MKAAVFHEHGDPDVLRIEDIAVPRPGPGEVRVAVKATALNHLDLWSRRGLPFPIPMPHIGGSDVAGVVAEVGRDAAEWEPGTRVVVNPSLWCGECEWCARGEHSLCVSFRVLGEHTQGGFAESVVVPARNLLVLPDGVAFEAAAAAALVFPTAWRGLMTRGRLRAGETVLITGASGGVGTAAVQIAAHAGARVYAVTTTEHVERVRELGAAVVFDRTAVDFSRELWRETGKRGVDLVLDSVGQQTWPATLRSLARGGRVVTYGATTGPSASSDLRAVFWKQLEIIGTTMFNEREFETAMGLVLGGVVEPIIDVIWPLERVRDAHERLEAGRQFGKIVLLP